MKVVKIIKDAAKMLGVKDVVESINGEDFENEEVQNFLVATNIVNNNIAANYIELINFIEVETSNGVIDIKDLTKNEILNIKSIKRCKDGLVATFKIRGDKIMIEDGCYVVEYSYFPSDLEIADEITYYTKINDMIFAQGVVAEYLFLKGDIQEAHNWDSKFKNIMRGTLRPRRNISMPQRRWR